MLTDIGENRTLLRAILLLVIVGTIPFYICGIGLWLLSPDANAPTNAPNGDSSVVDDNGEPTFTPLGSGSDDGQANSGDRDEQPTLTPLDDDFSPPTFTPFAPLNPTPPQFIPPTSFPTNPPPVFFPATDTPVPTFTPFPTNTPLPTSTPLPTDTPPPQATNTLLPFDPIESPTPIQGRSAS
jgi:hypothetical protein